MEVDASQLIDRALWPIAEKLSAGELLSAEDGMALYCSRDLHGVGRLANFVRESLHGDNTYYNRNRHINYTNVCALSCKFCSFYRKRGEEGAYEMPVEQVVATARKAADAGATEVHIVGGLHPWLKFDYYLEMLGGIRRESPQLHIKAFTAIEIIHFSRIAHMSIEEVLIALRKPAWAVFPAAGRRYSTIAFTMKCSRERCAKIAGLKCIEPRIGWESSAMRRCCMAMWRRRRSGWGI